MGGDLTAALFSGPELRGGGPGPFVRRCAPDFVVGHGLGDIAALAAAGVLAREDAIALAALREQLIARASAELAGGLLTVLDPDADARARSISALSGTHIARHDSPQRVVLGGSHEQLELARLAADELYVRIEEEDAAAPLHGSAMRDASRRFALALDGVEIRDATRCVYSTVTAAPMRDPRAELAAGLARPVLWRQTVRALDAAGAAHYVEAGPGHRLGDLVRQALTAEQPARARSELQPLH